MLNDYLVKLPFQLSNILVSLCSFDFILTYTWNIALSL